MSDIVERLRAPAYWISGSKDGHEGENSAPVEAAARIEQLEKALRKIADYNIDVAYERDGEMDWEIWRNMKQYARAALGEKA